MGSRSRPKPKGLAAKIRKIRESLDLSQNELIEKLHLRETIVRSTVSQWERGEREPSYLALLALARLAGICTDVLLDDELTLPPSLPSTPVHSS